MAEQVDVFGILPSEWWEKWSKRSYWYNEDGSFVTNPEKPGYDRVGRNWDQRFASSKQKPRAEKGYETVGEEEKTAFEAMIRSMLVFRPEERATVQQVLQSEWMEGWGRPALEQSGLLTP